MALSPLSLSLLWVFLTLLTCLFPRPHPSWAAVSVDDVAPCTEGRGHDPWTRCVLSPASPPSLASAACMQTGAHRPVHCWLLVLWSQPFLALQGPVPHQLSPLFPFESPTTTRHPQASICVSVPLFLQIVREVRLSASLQNRFRLHGVRVTFSPSPTSVRYRPPPLLLWNSCSSSH